MMGKNRPLKDDLLQCLCLLAIGLISYSPFIPEAIENILHPALFILLVVLLLVSLAQEQQRRNMSLEEQRDLARESRDERSLMIQSKAALLCHKAEDWGLLLLFTLFVLILDRREIGYVLYWVLVLRLCLYFAIRWWLNRKY